MFKFFAYLSRMKYIKRWSLMRSIREENIMEHTCDVVIISHALALIGNKMYKKDYDEKKVILYAQYHEVSEVVTGDLPTPIKYFNPEIKTAYKGLEKTACDKMLSHLPPEIKEEYQKNIFPDTSTKEYFIVKIADRISAYLKCVEELKAGNLEFKKAKISILNDLKRCDLPEVLYFFKEIAPAYELTLDELD